MRFVFPVPRALYAPALARLKTRLADEFPELSSVPRHRFVMTELAGPHTLLFHWNDYENEERLRCRTSIRPLKRMAVHPAVGGNTDEVRNFRWQRNPERRAKDSHH
jgi:hypothetical protein